MFIVHPCLGEGKHATVYNIIRTLPDVYAFYLMCMYVYLPGCDILVNRSARVELDPLLLLLFFFLISNRIIEQYYIRDGRRSNATYTFSFKSVDVAERRPSTDRNVDVNSLMRCLYVCTRAVR